MSDNTKDVWVYIFDYKEGLICKKLPTHNGSFGDFVAFDGNKRITLRKNVEFSTYGDICWSHEKDEIAALKAFLKVHENMMRDLYKRYEYEKRIIEMINSEMRDLVSEDDDA